MNKNINKIDGFVVFTKDLQIDEISKTTICPEIEVGVSVNFDGEDITSVTVNSIDATNSGYNEVDAEYIYTNLSDEGIISIGVDILGDTDLFSADDGDRFISDRESKMNEAYELETGRAEDQLDDYFKNRRTTFK